MKILNIINVLDAGYPLVGGAQITHLTFLRKLAERGHHCVHLDVSLTRRGSRRGTVGLDFFRDLDELRQKVERRRPDALLGGLHAIIPMVKLGTQLGIPTVAYMNSHEFSPPTADERRRWGFLYGKPYPSAAEREFVLRHADRVVTNSEHMRSRLALREGVESDVIYPAFELRDILLTGRRAEGEFVTGICGHPHKGTEVFLELARRFPEQKFLLVGSVNHQYFGAIRACANVTVLPFSPPKTFLRMSRVVLVPSRFPEPFGRIAVEAMANGIPTLASRTGGLAEIVGNSDLGVSRFRTADAWEAKLARLLDSPTERRRNGEQGRALSQRFLGDESIDRLEHILSELVEGRRTAADRRPVIAIRGRSGASTAFARVNAEWSARLAARGRFEVIDLPKSTSFSPRPVDVYVHHSYDEEFPTVSVPDEGRLVAVRTWDFGPFPPSWVAKINDECDRLWVHSAWVKSQAIAGGVQARKVQVIPHGFDQRVFTPRGPVYPVPTNKRFRFLFVGAAVLRKGIDILLNAYGEAFSREDDVCLIVKDRPGDLFYRGISFHDRIVERARDRRYPEIAYFYRHLPTEELAALYRAADVAVFPYRAEGFALPILEGMACGLPPIVPNFGACLDYCTSASSFQVAARRICLPINENLAINTLGFTADVTEVDFCEIPVDELARAMREAYELSPDRLRSKARRAADRAHGQFTWDHAIERIERELADVIAVGTPERLRRRRAERERSAKVFLAAREMYLNLDLAQSLPIRKH